MDFLPAHDFLLIRPIKENTSGSIVLPTDEKSAKKGEVLASGPGRTDTTGTVENTIAKDEIVFYPSYAEIAIRLDGEDLILVSEKDLLGKEKV